MCHLPWTVAKILRRVNCSAQTVARIFCPSCSARWGSSGSARDVDEQHVKGTERKMREHGEGIFCSAYLFSLISSDSLASGFSTIGLSTQTEWPSFIGGPLKLNYVESVQIPWANSCPTPRLQLAYGINALSHSQLSLLEADKTEAEEQSAEADQAGAETAADAEAEANEKATAKEESEANEVSLVSLSFYSRDHELFLQCRCRVPMPMLMPMPRRFLRIIPVVWFHDTNTIEGLQPTRLG